jgi:hypothetical protein
MNVALAKGNKDRKTVESMREKRKQEEEKEAAATKIQSVARGSRDRKSKKFSDVV